MSESTSYEPYYDPYHEAKIIAGDLDEFGLRGYAAQIRDALMLGTSGKELHLMLCWYMADILKYYSIPPKLKEKISPLHSYLDRVLSTQ
ncbi:MAG TPA: hypothetical protein VKT70_15185 [Stellaceae bacterium]|nr:hypothetical protein [Stellaceae bacterium]